MPVRGAGHLWGRAVDMVFLTRPLLLVASTTFFFAGVARGVSSPADVLRPATIAAIVPNLVLFGLVTASSFVINQVYDIESDRVNAKNFLLYLNRVGKWEALSIYMALSLAALVLGLGLGSPQMELGGAGLLLGLAYSVPPVRLKGRPVADMLANGVGFGFLGFALGWTTLQPFGRAVVLGAAPYVVAMNAIFLNTTIPDEAGDRLAGDCTSCILFGRRLTALLALLMLAASAVSGVLAGELRCSIAAIVSLPAFVALVVEPSPRVSVVASQFAGRAFFVVVSIAVPLLAVMGGAAYGLSRLYYARRLGLDYPRITGAREREHRSPPPGCRYRSTGPRGGS